MDSLYPLLQFAPVLKTVIWGGDKIARLKNLTNAPSLLGESWEVSAVPGSETVVDRGPLAGYNLAELTTRYGVELLGKGVIERNHGYTKFPLLVKIIDARGDLSIQVHPDDRLAAELASGQCGKTEMWHILHSDPGAEIHIGLNGPLTPEEYEKAVADHSIMAHVNSFPSVPGDIFFIPPGRIHAIGAGNLLIEIQQSCDITYRIYDYGRRDKDGNPRELHTELAKRAINFADNIPAACAPTRPAADGTMARCSCFDVRLQQTDTTPRPLARDDDSFLIVTVVSGQATLFAGGLKTELSTCETALVPACYASEAKVAGNGRIIVTRA